jgi:hypothetical protein
VFILEHLAQAAAVILILELMVLLIIFLAVSGGLVFGLHWVQGKTDPAFGKVNEYVGIGTGYVRKGTGYAALPLILSGRYAGIAQGTLDAIRRQVRRSEARETGLAVANEAAKSAQPEQEPNVLV